jgi:hypothetical protein
MLDLFPQSGFLALPQDDRMEALKAALRCDPSAVWPLISRMLLRKDEVGYRLLLCMQDWGLEEVMDVDGLLLWAHHYKPEGPRILAGLATVGGNPLHALARQLLVRYGNDKTIGSILVSRFLTGTWSGSKVEWLQGKLDLAQNWLRDQDAYVRKWAQELANLIVEDIKQARLREEEEGVRK